MNKRENKNRKRIRKTTATATIVIGSCMLLIVLAITYFLNVLTVQIYEVLHNEQMDIIAFAFTNLFTTVIAVFIAIILWDKSIIFKK